MQKALVALDELVFMSWFFPMLGVMLVSEWCCALPRRVSGVLLALVDHGMGRTLFDPITYCPVCHAIEGVQNGARYECRNACNKDAAAP